jgi:peptidoglycan hydrolase CwlO-like protein
MKLFPRLLSLSACLILSSCGDDPELVKKREQQKAEIARLEGEVALLTEKLESLPPDRSNELADIKIKAESQAAEMEKLDAEIVGLEAKKRALENEFDAYKKKYPVNR